MNVPVSRIPVAVLGATGAVGQTFIRCLADHPWFELTEVAASERSAGRQYGDVVRWLEGTLPQAVARQLVRPCDPAAVSAPVVFSALDSSVAGDVEAAFARAGRLVLSNAKNFRMAPDVPLVIPEVNGDHLALLTRQRELRGWAGGIVTNANCAVTVVAMALAPLHAAFGVRRVMVATMQAVSGAGYPGVPSLDILGNVIPYIGDEEPKIETELTKLLGTLDGGAIVPAPIVTSAHANRVPVAHGLPVGGVRAASHGGGGVGGAARLARVGGGAGAAQRSAAAAGGAGRPRSPAAAPRCDGRSRHGGHRGAGASRSAPGPAVGGHGAQHRAWGGGRLHPERRAAGGRRAGGDRGARVIVCRFGGTRVQDAAALARLASAVEAAFAESNPIP
jgi:aspartate-semialdehyde dehydrogenase